MSLESFAVGILALVIGTALCVAGYRAFRTLIAVWGFFAGFVLTTQVFGTYSGNHLIVSPLALIIAVIIGLVLAGLAYQLVNGW